MKLNFILNVSCAITICCSQVYCTEKNLSNKEVIYDFVDEKENFEQIKLNQNIEYLNNLYNMEINENNSLEDIVNYIIKCAKFINENYQLFENDLFKNTMRSIVRKQYRMRSYLREINEKIEQNSITNKNKLEELQKKKELIIKNLDYSIKLQDETGTIYWKYTCLYNKINELKDIIDEQKNNIDQKLIENMSNALSNVDI